MSIDRNSVIRDIINIYIEVTQIFTEEEKASFNENTNITKDIKINDDDHMLVIEEIHRHFSIIPTQADWDKVLTIRDIANIIIKYKGHAKKTYTTYELESAWPEWIKKMFRKIGIEL